MLWAGTSIKKKKEEGEEPPINYLYYNPSYPRILIGSRLWSIRGQTHRWRKRLIKVFLNFLNFEFEPIITNLFASFCIDIRSRQCYFRVCQSGEIWNKNAFFPYILIFYYIKQIDSMLPCVCSVIDNRGRQNVVRTSVTHSAAPHFFVLTTFWRHLWSNMELKTTTSVDRKSTGKRTSVSAGNRKLKMQSLGRTTTALNVNKLWNCSFATKFFCNGVF